MNKTKMERIVRLKQLFEEINQLKNKASINTSQFCSELIHSDDDDFLELHFSLLEQKKKYFQSDLKLYFTFRQSREKVHYFLKNKLQNLTDEPLKKDVEEILNDIGFHTLEEYKQWIADIKSEKRNDKNKFVWSIIKSSFVEFHYEVMNDPKLDEEFRRDLAFRFNEHGEEAEDFLISKLDNNQDTAFQADIIFHLGRLNKKHKAKILDYARKFAESEDYYKRDRAIIVLGWIGTIEDTEILKKHLLQDQNSKCRAWSASSYMQMWLKNQSEAIKTKAFEAYRSALDTENDYFVLSVILASICTIGKTKLGISQTAIDEVNIEKIDLAKPKAIRFLDRELKKIYN